MKLVKKNYSPTKVYFGSNSLLKINSLLGSKKKVLVITSKRGGKLFKKEIKKNLNLKNKYEFIDKINSYPSASIVDYFFKKIFKKKFDFILGYGGGSVLDFAKIVKAYLSINKKINIKNLILKIDDFEEKHKIKLLLIPTTSGTGSEVTSFATVWDIKTKKKLSLNSKKLFADYAIVDPNSTININYENRLFTGLDAINQLFDSYWNKNSNYKSKVLATKGIQLGIDSLLKLKKHKFDSSSRLKISKASLLSGFCISKTRTSICHSISYPLTSYYKVPHGLACFFTTLAVFDFIKINNSKVFNILIKNSKYDNLKKIRSDLIKIYRKHHVIKNVKKYVRNFENINKLTKFMFTKGRSDNFCLPLTENTVKKILFQSYNQS